MRSGGVEVNTVDRYQGRDKDCVIVSFVRSNDGRNVSAKEAGGGGGGEEEVGGRRVSV